MNTAIAVILFLLTSISGYILWYIVRGHSKKMKRLQGQSSTAEDENKGTQENPSGRIPKDSYCYPAINDIMGYEFISVVNVPQELLTDTKAAKPQEDWGSSESIGLKAVSRDDGTSAVNEDEPWDWGEEEGSSPIRNIHKEPSAENNEHETVELSGDVAQEDIEMLDKMAKMPGADWGHRDYDTDDADPDETINVLINNNSELIDDPGDATEDDIRTAREAQALLQMKMLEDRGIELDQQGSLGADILAQLDEDEDYTEDDDGEPGREIDADDIPEI